MRVGPTLATGKQGWDKLIGRAVAGFPSHRPGKQEEKAAKPPSEKKREGENRLGTLMIFHRAVTQHHGTSAEALVNQSRTPLAEQTDSRQAFREESGLQRLGLAQCNGSKKEALCASVC